MSSKVRCIPRKALRRVLRVQQRRAARSHAASHARNVDRSVDRAGVGEVRSRNAFGYPFPMAQALHRGPIALFHSNDIEESQ